MTTYATNNPVGSTDPRDLYDNAQNFDHLLLDQDNLEWPDRLGIPRKTWAGLQVLVQEAASAFGFIILSGVSFTTGATVHLNEVLLDESSGEYYQWTGNFPSEGKVVPPASSPSSTGGEGPGKWMGVGYAALKAMLANANNISQGDALIAVKQPFTGAIARTQHEVNADMVVNVKDCGGIGNGSASSAADIAAVQAAINAYAPMITPVHVKIPRGTWNLSGITIPRRGVVLDLTEATIVASSGVVFSRTFAQVAAADFKAANPPLDGNQTYFRPIVIKGGTVNLSGTATFLEIRQPYLAEYSIWGKTLIINDTQIKVYGSSKAFGIHGGWGFDLNTVSVTGDVTASTGYGSSVGSGTFLELRPDGTYYASSHPQLINMNNCNISYCKVLDGSKGSCTNSCEALVFNNSACMFVDGGDIQAVNLFQYYGGMFVTTAREMVCSGMAGTRINGVQMQRYNNPRTEQRRGGSFSFVGGGNDIVISDIRGQAGAGLNGAMVSFVAVSGEQFIDIDVSNFKQASGALTNINEPDTGLQTCAVRLITGGTGTITGITFDNITGINLHNIVDMGDSAAVQSMSRVNVTRIRNITTTVKRRVRWTPENVGQLNAPELYKQATVRMKGTSNSAGTNVSCLTDPFFTGLTGTITGTRITTSGISNSTGIALREMQEGGVAILDLYQSAGLSAGASVEASGQFRFSSADSILS